MLHGKWLDVSGVFAEGLIESCIDAIESILGRRIEKRLRIRLSAVPDVDVSTGIVRRAVQVDRFPDGALERLRRRFIRSV